MSTPRPATDNATVIPLNEPSQNTEAEQAVLGAVMYDVTVLADIEAELGDDPGIFYRPAHETIWRTIRDLAAGGVRPDPILLADALRKSGDLDRVGGPGYLHQCAQAVPTAANGPYYARIVREQAEERQLTQLGTRIVQAGRAPGVADRDELIATARDLIDGATSESRWPEPIPLGQQGPLPAFPVDALPAWVADQVAAVAEFTQTPADMAATMALAALATAAGGRAHVQIRPGWVEQTNLYLIVAMPPASRKSDVFAQMTAPIYAVERELQERAQPGIIEAEIAREAAEGRAEAAMMKAKKADDATASHQLVAEATGLRMDAEAITVPARPRLTASGDVTPEALTKLLTVHGRIGVLSPEGDLFDIIAGRYSARPNLGVFLQGHKGERLQTERITRDAEHGERPALTIGITLQPPVLTDLARTPGARGRGLLARILFALPPSTLGYRKTVVPPVPEKTAHAYETRLTTLVHTLGDLPEPVTLTCSPAADRAILQLQEDVEPKLRPDGALAHIDDWAGKYVGAVARLAGLLHLAEHLHDGWGKPIEAATVERARAIGDYYTAHALAAFDLMGSDPVIEDAREVLAWLQRTGRTTFKAHELVTGRRQRFPTVAKTKPALRLLQEHGYLRATQPTRQGTRGQRPAATYWLHPSGEEPTKARTQG